MNRETTLKNLQTALAMELTAAHQYQLHASLLSAWGMDRLAAKRHREMQEELDHSDDYIMRIAVRGVPVLYFMAYHQPERRPMSRTAPEDKTWR